MGYKSILLTLDGSLFAEQALQHVVSLAEPGALIHVVSVLVHEPIDLLTGVARSSSYFTPFSYSDVFANQNSLTAENNAHLAHNRQSYLEQVTRQLVEAGYTVTLEVRTGDPVKAIIDAAQNGCEVILMATHGRTGFSKALLGSVAETVLRQAPCPLLLIPVRAVELAN